MADQQMLALMSGDKASFEQLVQALMSPQNAERQSAETLFNQLKDSNVNICATNLVAVLRTSQQQDSRTISAVLLRRVHPHYCRALHH